MDKISEINNPRKKFIIKTISLFLSIHGRINFLQLDRFSDNSEQMYRKLFEVQFKFLELNSNMVEDNCSPERIIAFDPSYVSKSGKKTPGLGHFWSGCAQDFKWGLEFCGIVTVDIQKRTAFHLEAVQTIQEESKSL